jgi:hypothetical protein
MTGHKNKDGLLYSVKSAISTSLHNIVCMRAPQALGSLPLGQLLANQSFTVRICFRPKSSSLKMGAFAS